MTGQACSFDSLSRWTVKLRFGYVSRNLTMATVRSRIRTACAAFAGAALLYGCASSSSKRDEPAPVSTPLAGMAGRQLLVLPAQYLSVANPAGGWDIVPSGPSLLPILDEEIADTFRKRGVRANWTFAREITQSAARNAGLAGDPRQLSVQGIRRLKPGDTPLPEPLASEIRNLVSLTSARYALLPLEVHVDVRGIERRGSARFLLIDARTARVTWSEDIEATTTREAAIAADAFTPFGFRMMSRDVASKLADMVVAQ